jgi:hypothetical protein
MQIYKKKSNLPTTKTKLILNKKNASTNIPYHHYIYKDAQLLHPQQANGYLTKQ